jgi:phosphatidylserine decarboxylase
MATKKKKISINTKWYTTKFGVMAGYMAGHHKQINEWFTLLAKNISKEKKSKKAAIIYKPSVQELANLIDSDAIVRMYVTRMIEEVPLINRQIKSVAELLDALNYIIQRSPEFHCPPAASTAFPMSNLFVYMMFTPSGEAAFRNFTFNAAIRKILQEWCKFLDSLASRYVLNTGTNGWLSPCAYKVNELQFFLIPDKKVPYWGFKSYNDYFHRQINLLYRPIQGQSDSKVIVSANDGTVYNIQRNVKKTDTFWIKSQPYSLSDMLNGSTYTNSFVGGDVFQAFLSGANYHRWRSPVSGTIKEARIVNGLMFSELHSEGFDPDAGTLSQGFEASVNTRGLVFIDSDDKKVGMVCVIPIGITEISSVTLGATIKPGKHVNKGDELGKFSYGGSTLCLVFQPGVIKEFITQNPTAKLKIGDLINVNAQIAIAN